MQKEDFEIAVTDWQEIHSLPDTWSTEELRALLEEAEFEDQIEDADVEDMTLMVLQDLGLRQASDLVLQAVFGARMGSGVRQNLVSELEEDRPWEQFADVDRQADIFRAVTLLQKAYPNLIGTPDAVRMRMTVRPHRSETGQWLRDPDPGLIVRLLAGGMPEDAVLRRLFEEDLTGKRFPAAAHILWQIRSEPTDGGSSAIDVISSHQWLDPLQRIRHWQCAAWRDEQG